MQRLVLVLAMVLVGLISGNQPVAKATIWAQGAPPLEPLSEFAIAQLDGKAYTIGGYPQSRVYVDTVQVYDSATQTWSYAAPTPIKLHHSVAAGANGKVYALGGEISTTGLANQGIYINNVYEYDPATDAWTEKAPMPTPRSGGGAGVIGSKIYVAGGRPPGGSAFEAYDTATDTWEVLPNLPTQRNHLAVTAIGGQIYVAGGRFGGGVGSEMTDALEIYNPVTNLWTSGARMPEVRAGNNGIGVNGCFYTFGGEGNDPHPLGLFHNNEVYDPRSDTWHVLEPIPTAVHGVTGAAYFNGWIHLPGGGIARGGSSGAQIHQMFQPVVDCSAPIASGK